MFNVCNLMSLDICLQPWYYHHNHNNNKKIHHLQKFSCVHLFYFVAHIAEDWAIWISRSSFMLVLVSFLSFFLLSDKIWKHEIYQLNHIFRWQFNGIKYMNSVPPSPLYLQNCFHLVELKPHTQWATAPHSHPHPTPAADGPGSAARLCGFGCSNSSSEWDLVFL